MAIDLAGDIPPSTVYQKRMAYHIIANLKMVLSVVAVTKL